MKRILLPTFLILFLASCGKSKSAKEIAQEICDCSKKANALPVSDPNRTQAQNDCTKKNQEGWNKVKDDFKKAEEFNKVLSACASEQIRKSFGQ